MNPKILERCLWIVMFQLLCVTKISHGQVLPKTDHQLYKEAQDVFNQRCVTCHSCYSSPCQLNLTSFEGIARGALNDPIYDGTRLTPQKPSRLFIDAHSEAEWREKFGFHPVISAKLKDQSILVESIHLGQKRGLGYQGHQFDTKKNWQCPKQEDWSSFAEESQIKGMPFGFPPLKPQELTKVVSWAQAGFPKSPKVTYPAATSGKVNQLILKWEKWLNGDDLKQRIVSRYLYEHWFIAHMNFQGFDHQYFRLVRSYTNNPKQIKEIPSTRPFDDPGTKKFYYRFIPISEPIMHKNHIVFELSNEHMERFNRELIKGTWVSEPKAFPSFESKKAANPFLTYQDMPLEGRYRFLLRNARYFTRTYIRGPVCEGQVAVNVIRDQFIIIYMDPKSDLSVQDPDYLKEAMPYLTLPAAGQSSPIDSYIGTYNSLQRDYAKFRATKYYQNKAFTYKDESIWHGQGDPNALLTVFRHFDNSSVIYGAKGGAPRTVWMMDFPIFERMYYLLVAGFNVFGNVFHQSATRLYMDNLRIESENNFLYLLPEKDRHSIREYWYQGEDAFEKIREGNPMYSSFYGGHLIMEPFIEKDGPHKKVNKLIKALLSGPLKKQGQDGDPYHCCLHGEDLKSETEWDQALRSFTAKNTSFARFLPESFIISLYSNRKGDDKLIFGNKLSSHQNVAFMFGEKDRRNPDLDRVILTDEWVGSYPNLIFHGSKTMFIKMVGQLVKAKNKADVQGVLGNYFVSRDARYFWTVFDKLHDKLEKKYPDEFGLLDLSKYANLYKKARPVHSGKKRDKAH